MKVNDKLEIVESDLFSNSTVYRMTLKYEGETVFFRGEEHEYGGDYYWYNAEGNKIAQPDWVDELEESLEKEDKSLFSICEENSKPWLLDQVREELEQILKLLWGGSETENIEAHNRLAVILKEKVEA